ncbi:MAG: pantetheine-phosphate adenylyltransferase [Spirochaetaceae bacterium]
MKNIVFPGSFDPPTYGHLDIVSRCASIFDNVTILIAENSEKETMFSINTRLKLIKEMISDFSNVSVDYYEGLVVEYAKLNDINIIVRGIRNNVDYNYESEIEMANSYISDIIETVYINARPGFTNIKSSLVKELFKYNVDISTLVTPSVYKEMKDQY